jgi:glutathione reductase (NADPH)
LANSARRAHAADGAADRESGGQLPCAQFRRRPYQTVAADLVVQAAGRAPDLDALDLTAAEAVAERGRLKLNEFLQSASNPKVYAAGDAASSGPPLTPVSSHDGKIIAGNLLDGNRHKPDYRGVPSVAFTISPIAAVGLGEADARAKGSNSV